MGNQAFANYVDANVKLTHVNNKFALYYISIRNIADLVFSIFTTDKTSFPSCQVCLYW